MDKNFWYIIFGIIVAVFFFARKLFRSFRNIPIKLAGMEGERIGASVIEKVLRSDDRMLRNVSVSYKNKPCEMDNLVVNNNGVFIIEVKNYKGVMKGGVDDYEWDKLKDDGYGNTFEKKVKNPIRQVNRQVYILANYLREHGVDVWVEGYAYFINDNCPVASDSVLHSLDDIDKALHKEGRRPLDDGTVQAVLRVLG